MLVISNSSPLIALSRINILFILKEIFEKIFIPDSVYQETVVEADNMVQQQNINKAIEENYIRILSPRTYHLFKRNLGKGEIGVLTWIIHELRNYII